MKPEFLTCMRGDIAIDMLIQNDFQTTCSYFIACKLLLKCMCCVCMVFPSLHCYCTSALCSRHYCCTMGSIGPVSTEVCCDIFRELRSQSVQENVCYSPLLIISTLSMVYIGAKDNTKAQIEKVRI